MRVAARLKLGYYPLPVEQGPMLRARLAFPSLPTAALDPCCGTGAALHVLTGGSNSTLYGVELDANRAESAKGSGIQTIQGNVFDVRARVERFSFLYLNPPYDFEMGPRANERMEKLFLGHTYAWLKPKGVLLMVIPCKAVFDVSDTLSTRFKDIAIYRLVGEESEKYDQCAIFGIRHNNNGHETILLRQSISRMMCYPKQLPVLTPEADRMYSVPPSGNVEIYHVGLPLDEIEDRLITSNAWKELAHPRRHHSTQSHRRNAVPVEDQSVLPSPRRITMKNAHLRLTQVEYSVQSKNWSTRVEVWCDRLATEDNTTHMLSIFGNDSEMAAVSGAISTNSRLTAKLPDGSKLELFMGQKPTTYRGHLSIPGRLRPVRHILCFSEALMQNGTNGSVTVLHNDDTLIWATVISFLGLPALPEWAGPGVQMLRNTEKIREIIGFNCSPVTVTITREELLQWIGLQVAEKFLFLPEAAGPVIWPSYGIKDLLSASVIDEDELEVAA